ncbi:polysaccharide lyase beta-sandwich domain-containing protein [Nonomuraea typhae]|uniref:Polysaccharide lyase beta-sandwich domain-containing protein n=1 Tax=Nonomuraea typhae TaxID=2603600 RepID=A0ABW7YVK8_9ACTN
MLWLDHGVDPVNASYAYVLIPGSRGPQRLSVLANTSRQQAIHVPSLGLTAAAFWQPGTAGPLTASAPCAVLVREKGDGTATVTVADPRMDLDRVTVTWNHHVLVFDLPERDGASRTATIPV